MDYLAFVRESLLQLLDGEVHPLTVGEGIGLQVFRRRVEDGLLELTEGYEASLRIVFIGLGVDLRLCSEDEDDAGVLVVAVEGTATNSLDSREADVLDLQTIPAKASSTREADRTDFLQLREVHRRQ